MNVSGKGNTPSKKDQNKRLRYYYKKTIQSSAENSNTLPRYMTNAEGREENTKKVKRQNIQRNITMNSRFRCYFLIYIILFRTREIDVYVLYTFNAQLQYNWVVQRNPLYIKKPSNVGDKKKS